MLTFTNILISIILLIVVLFIFYTIVVYNLNIKKQTSVKHSKSTIDVYLKERFDLIPNLVECVKGYSFYEANIFTKITELRTNYLETNDLETGGILDTKINKLIVNLESYPDLKANDQFLNLQKSLAKMENQIQAARRVYNNDVEKYNNSISTFPNNILAKIFKFKKENFFYMEEE